MTALKVIYKYAMSLRQTITVPVGIVRHAEAQRPHDALPTFWIEHEVSELEASSPSTMEIALVGTGHLFQDDPSWTFIGTAVCANGSLVWHCWSRPAPGGRS